MKKRFIYLTPLTYTAKNDFEDLMNGFHSCEIKKEEPDRFLVTTLNQEHTFWISKKGNKHWKIEL